MESFIQFAGEILLSWQSMAFLLLGVAAAFTILNRISPCNKNQRFQPRALLTDMGYYFIAPLSGRFITSIYFGLGILLFFRDVPQDQVLEALTYGFGPLGKLPIWLQAAIIFIVSDIMLYWIHRTFHTSGLWHYHAVHHSAEHLDWHSTYRFHPVNIWLSFTLVDTIMMFAGFSVQAISLMGVFNTFYSAMVHSNLNWTFGPFKYIFSSPVFHRWHHTTQIEGLNKNFAPTFPLLDVIFGTFYMPEARLPEEYGILGGTVPKTFIGQLLYPFKKR